LHGIDAAGRPVPRTNLSRAQMIPFFRKLRPTTVAMEARKPARLPTHTV